MEKKESPNIKDDFELKPSGGSGKMAGLSRVAFGVIKFCLGIGLLPFVYSITTAFLSEFCLIQQSVQGYFWSGIITLVIIYLFIWEPAIIYAKGQKALEVIFNFFKPLVKVAPYLLPIYTIILFLIYALLSIAVKSEWLIKYSIFLFGFSIALHLIFSAKSIRSKKSDFLKANYIFGFSFVYIVSLTMLSFFINLIFKEFSVVNFFNNTVSLAKDIFCAVFKQLFLR